MKMGPTESSPRSVFFFVPTENRVAPVDGYVGGTSTTKRSNAERACPRNIDFPRWTDIILEKTCWERPKNNNIVVEAQWNTATMMTR